MLICTHKCPGFSLLCHSFSSWLLFLKFPYNPLVTVSFSWWLSPSLAWWEFRVTRTHSLHLPTLPAVTQAVLEEVGYLYTPLCSHPMYPTAESMSGWRNHTLYTVLQHMQSKWGTPDFFWIAERKPHSIRTYFSFQKKRTAMLQLLLTVEKSCSLEWEDKLRGFLIKTHSSSSLAQKSVSC